MRISARCDYACRALLELSLHWPREDPVHIQQIAEKQSIPSRYLVQILIQLRRAGIVASHRGKQGGYTLAKAPAEIKLGEIIREMVGPLLPVSGIAVIGRSVFSGIWKEVEDAMTQILDSVTFEDISNKVESSEKVLTYQI